MQRKTVDCHFQLASVKILVIRTAVSVLNYHWVTIISKMCVNMCVFVSSGQWERLSSRRDRVGSRWRWGRWRRRRGQRGGYVGWHHSRRLCHQLQRCPKQLFLAYRHAHNGQRTRWAHPEHASHLLNYHKNGFEPASFVYLFQCRLCFSPHCSPHEREDSPRPVGWGGHRGHRGSRIDVRPNGAGTSGTVHRARLHRSPASSSRRLWQVGATSPVLMKSVIRNASLNSRVLSSVHTGAQVSPKRNLLTLQTRRTAAKTPRTTPAWPPLCGSGHRTAGKSFSRTPRNFWRHTNNIKPHSTIISVLCSQYKLVFPLWMGRFPKRVPVPSI